MSVRVVAPEVAEAMVPVKRSQRLHYGRGSRNLGEFFVLHSQDCLNSGIDLATCPYSQVMAGTDLNKSFEPEYVYLLSIEGGGLAGVRGIKVPEITLDKFIDTLMVDLPDEEPSEDTEPVDYGAEAQRAAERHLEACWAFLHEESDEDPSDGLFDGCQTCEVREVLSAAYPILEKGWREDHGITA